MKSIQTIYNVLGGIQLFISLGALGAGWLMITNPSGHINGMSVEILADSPFSDFFIPGMVLFVVNGLGNLLGSFLAFNKKEIAGNAAIMLGVLLIGWLVFQIFWIGFYPIIQLLYMFLGFSELVLGYLILKHKEV